MKYKVGDRVRIKSIDWYNKNKDNYGSIYAGNGFVFWKNMIRHCGEIMKITIVKVDPEDSNKGYYFMENSEERWTDEMIEGLVEEEVSYDIDSEWLKHEISLPKGYIFKDENGNVINATKIVLEKKKKEYPKTYEECCTVLHFHYDHYLTYDDEKDINPTKEEEEFIDLMDVFSRLIICRNAYWKIYGENMGLGKPWEPDWNNISDKYCIYFVSGDIWSKECQTRQCPFAFPTPEMRDAFYENFKELIESCKEFL